MRLRLYDAINWDATHHKQTNWIGENVDLTATLEGKEAFEATGVTVTLTNVAWSVPTTKAFSNYYHDTFGIHHSTFPLDRPSINFHWLDAIDPATVSASGQVIVNGTTFSIGPAPTYYRVNRPSTTFSGTKTGAIQIVDDALTFGLDGVEDGITITATHPDVGEWGMIQLVQASSILIQTSSGCSLKTASGADGLHVGDYLYIRVRGISNGFGFQGYDAPSSWLDPEALRLKRTDMFTSWLMFRPPNGTYVPVRKLDWSWGAAAVQVSGIWGMDPNDHPYTTIGSGDTTTVFPVWTTFVQANETVTMVPCP
jgi:hypothetical protein